MIATCFANLYFKVYIHRLFFSWGAGCYLCKLLLRQTGSLQHDIVIWIECWSDLPFIWRAALEHSASPTALHNLLHQGLWYIPEYLMGTGSGVVPSPSGRVLSIPDLCLHFTFLWSRHGSTGYSYLNTKL